MRGTICWIMHTGAYALRISAEIEIRLLRLCISLRPQHEFADDLATLEHLVRLTRSR
jgi:hypothetical protein